MKSRKINLKKFSEELNNVFSLLNDLTGSEVFQSSVFKYSRSIYIVVCLLCATLRYLKLVFG